VTNVIVGGKEGILIQFFMISIAVWNLKAYAYFSGLFASFLIFLIGAIVGGVNLILCG